MKHSRVALTALVLALGLYPSAASATYPGSNGVIMLWGTNGVIWVFDSDGSNPRALANGRSAHWTANGERVYFSGGPDCPDPTYACSIYSVRANGTGLRRQTWPASGQYDDDPYPLPGGGFVFTRSPVVYSPAELWMKLPGQRAKRLTWTEASEFYPAVSPDGTRIAYFRGELGAGTFLYVMSTDGTAKRKLTPAPGDGGVDFSPDGTRLVFAGEGPVPGEPTEGVFFHDLRTGTTTRVGSLESSEPGWSALSFSPDGTRLLINSGTPYGNSLFSTDLSGGDSQGIPVNPPSGGEFYFGGGYWQPVP